MQIVEYAKAHPWATGIIVVVGGIIFIAIFSGGGGSADTAANGQSGPSDAVIAANIQAQAAVQAAQVGAGVQMNSDNKAAEVAMAGIGADKDVNLAYLETTKTLGLAEYDTTKAAIGAENQKWQTVIGALPSLKKKNRDDVLKSLVTGEYGYAGGPNYGNSAGGIISGIGSAVGSVGKLFSVFSDQRLKENIVYIGTDDNGNRIYEWNYKGSNKRWRGRLAQEVADKNPDEIEVANNGFIMVHNNMIEQAFNYLPSF